MQCRIRKRIKKKHNQLHEAKALLKEGHCMNKDMNNELKKKRTEIPKIDFCSAWHV